MVLHLVLKDWWLHPFSSFDLSGEPSLWRSFHQVARFPSFLVLRGLSFRWGLHCSSDVERDERTKKQTLAFVMSLPVSPPGIRSSRKLSRHLGCFSCRGSRLVGRGAFAHRSSRLTNGAIPRRWSSQWPAFVGFCLIAWSRSSANPRAGVGWAPQSFAMPRMALCGTSSLECPGP